MKEILQISNLTKKYVNGRGVFDIGMGLFPGEIHVLLGANGAGKSTLMRILAGVMAQDKGEIILSNRFDVSVSDPIVQRLTSGGFLIEQPEPYGYLTAIENLMQKARYYEKGRESAEEALKLAGLEAFKHDKARTFSTGMKQRLGLALAITGNPSFLVLDEPTNGMDIIGRAEFNSLLKVLRSKGMSILLSTHLVHEAEELADRISIIHEGKLLSSGLKKDLLYDGNTLEKWYLGEVAV